MDTAKPTIVVTGVSGNLGQRLIPQLADYRVVGVDITPPTHSPVDRFVPLDLGNEESTREMLLLLRELKPASVVHLAFVIDPQRSGVLDVDRMWRINVAGTARMMEAITEANRNAGATIRQFIFPSSVSAYGSDLQAPAAEGQPLGAHTLPYAIHKKESDLVVQQRAPALRGCGVFILRPHIFAGATVENYLMGAFRGTPNGKGARAARMRQASKRLPCMLPYGQKYLDNKIQFVDIDEPEAQRLTILNVAGRGDPLTFAQCIEMAHAKLLRVPGPWAMRRVLQFLWDWKISSIPPDAVPYMTGQYIMNTDRLKDFLGKDYERVIAKPNLEAFADSFPRN
jgi:nucleoside-diphosphate-sugar epimerase